MAVDSQSASSSLKAWSSSAPARRPRRRSLRRTPAPPGSPGKPSSPRQRPAAGRPFFHPCPTPPSPASPSPPAAQMPSTHSLFPPRWPQSAMPLQPSLWCRRGLSRGIRVLVFLVECHDCRGTLDEENEHAYPAGKTVVPVGHVKLIVPVKPPDAVIVTVAIPALPATNATGFGDTLTLKSPAVIGWLAESAACQLLSPR